MTPPPDDDTHREGVAARLSAVQAWLDRLRGPAPDVGPLSTPNLRRVLDDALDALSDLPAAVAELGPPPGHATVIAPRTVLTAALEGVAVLLAAGAAVTLKPPRDAPGLAPWFVDQARGLPLRLDVSHDAVAGADLVLAMGGDDTMAALRAAVPKATRLLAFGHRIGAAWWPRGADTAGLAADLAAHDGRGCMTPAVILSDDPDLPALAAAMADAEARWPRGAVSPGEHAALRARTLRARVVGQALEGPGWVIHHVPLDHVDPYALPRAAQVVTVPDADTARAWIAARPVIGTLGGPRDAGWADGWGVDRACALGEMQRPPLRRVHDGVRLWAGV